MTGHDSSPNRGRSFRVSAAVKLAADIAAAVAAAAIVAVVVVRAATAPAPRPLPPATPDQRTLFTATVAGQEGEWRDKAADDFPADLWSQRDAFHGHEAAAVRDLARGAGVSYEAVFRAIDEDVHRSRGADRSANAIPCKPRPIFD